MRIGELAKRTGLTTYTLRYYEQIGLLPCPSRGLSGIRDYDESVLGWIEFLGRLKTTGMPIRDMLRYTALREMGACTRNERRKLLEDHRDHVRVRITELETNIQILDDKIAGYAD